MIRGFRRGSNLPATRGITSVEAPMSMAKEATPVFYRMNAHRFLFLPLLFLLSCVSLHAKTQQPNPADGFLARSYHSAGGETMQYRLFVPPGYSAARKYPIVLWLHGANGRGSDNLLQISGGNFLGTHVWTAAEIQDERPCIRSRAAGGKHKNLVAPPREYRSAGLATRWLSKFSMRLKKNIQSIVIANTSRDNRWAEKVCGRPWRWHTAVLRRQSRCVLTASTMKSSLTQKFLCGFFRVKPIPSFPSNGPANGWQLYAQAGGSPKYTEVPGVGHNVWDTAFANPDAATWLLSQRRAK